MIAVLFENLPNLEKRLDIIDNCNSGVELWYLPLDTALLLFPIVDGGFFHLHMLYIRVGDDVIWPLVPRPR
jgi:hypothetical protein